MKPRELPAWLWLWVPVILLPIPLIALGGRDWYRPTFLGELGIIENVTFVAIVVGIVAALRLLVVVRPKDPKILAFVVLMTLGSIYYAGEEISWGQHFFGFGTPEGWSEINRQQETNLHNTSPLFDKLPRLLFTIAAAVGGVIIPLKRRNAPPAPADSIHVVWPTLVCTPSALCALFVSFPWKVGKWLGSPPPIDVKDTVGELKELYLGLFLMLYLLSLSRRLSSRS
ncbi:MAG: hypothetical protein GY716_09605 [bacterium]|nr:hypothetical protein [bacterium]